MSNKKTKKDKNVKIKKKEKKESVLDLYKTKKPKIDTTENIIMEIVL